MPSAADLLEVIFMGPGLVCLILIPLFYLPMWMKKRAGGVRGQAKRLEDKGKPAAAIQLLDQEIKRLRRKSDKSELADLLHWSASLSLLCGRINTAITQSTEAVRLFESLSLRKSTPYLTLGQALSRGGDDKQALAQFRRAVELLPDDPEPAEIATRALAYANLSIALQRTGDTDEALQLATEAVTAGLSIPDDLPRFAQAASGWAHLALALAQTDSGLDGREAAQQGRRVFRELAESGELAEGDGVAFGCYTIAYAARPFGDSDAAELAREAVERFAVLETKRPGLYSRRLATAMALTEAFRRLERPSNGAWQGTI